MPQQLEEWFWTGTAAARLIAAATGALENHPDPWIRVLADRAIVPRKYKKRLISTIKRRNDS